jgi:hypothetical protein
MQDNLPTLTGAIQRSRAVLRRIADVIRRRVRYPLDWAYFVLTRSRLTDWSGNRERVRQLEDKFAKVMSNGLALVDSVTYIAEGAAPDARPGPGSRA